MKLFSGNRRGQLVVSNLFYIVMLLVVMAAVYQPLILDVIVTPHENDSGTAGVLINLIPVFYWLGGLFLVFITFMPVRQPGYG